MSLLLQGVLFIVVILSAIFATGGSVTSPSPSISSEVPQNIRNTSSLVSAIKAHIISAPGPVTHPKGFASYPLLVSPTASPIHASNENGRPGSMSPSVEHQTAGPASAPSFSSSPLNHELNNGVPVAAHPNEISNNRHLVSSSYTKGSSPVMSPQPHVVEPPNVTVAPLSSQLHHSSSNPVVSPISHDMKPPTDARAPLGSSPVVNPMPHEGKARLNVTLSPLPSNLHPSETSPMLSPVPNELNDPSTINHVASHPQPSGSPPAISPTLHGMEEPSHSSHSHLPSHPSPLESSFPIKSPTPHELEPSNFSHAPLYSHSSSEISPTPHEVKEPSNVTDSPLHLFSPIISPTPHEVMNPSNITHAPLSSNPKPLGSSPAISPASQELKDPSKTTNAPLASHPEPSRVTPPISPRPQEVNKPSNATPPLPSHPLPSESSPVMSPVRSETNNPSNITRDHLASNPKPSKSSPARSPTPHEAKEPSYTTQSPLSSHKLKGPLNITNAPLASHLKPSGSSLTISPTPQEVNETSNASHSPLPSHLLSSPLISPTPHEVKEPSNITHSPLSSHQLKGPSNITNAPVASHRKPSGSSPMISPTPQEVNETSNAAPPPLPLLSFPSPLISPTPHEVKDPSNITHTPSTSPTISPTPHELKEPSNATHSPVPSHPFPLQSSPAMSPEPHEVKEPSNVTHSLSPLHPHLSNYSHALSPSSHAVTDSLNKTHAPLASSSPVLSTKPHELHNSSHITHAPLASHAPPPLESALAPLTSSHRRNSRIKTGSPSFSPLSSLRPPSHHPGPVVSAVPQISPVSQNNRRRDHAPPPYSQGTSFSPAEAPSQPPVVVPKNNQRRHHAPTPNIQVPSHSPIQSPFPSKSHVAHPPSQRPIYSPILPPSGASASRKPRAPPPLSVWALPPPPPNTDCKSLTCFEPNTYPPPGSLCACVLPIKVRLRLYIALYTFFPLVSELAHEIASGIFVNQSQVRIMGANADLEDPEKTIVIIDLVPLGGYFHMNSALLIFQKFWHKQVAIKAMYFVDYDVLAVLYPGLPPSPPTAPGDGSVDGSTFDNGENARSIKPLGVDVGRRKGKVRGSLIAIIVLSSVSVLVSAGVAWLLLLKCRDRARQPPAATPQQALHPFVKSSVAATGPPPLGSGPSSTTTSFSSSIAGSAKTFSLPEIERATNRFHESRIIGEGGFGRVYLGTLEDGTMVAVKVLKRDDQQGGREFLAEVEMLSRLHHRNLVKLIGICTEESARCLVYELIPNGSVESHLHGIDKETSPLDWNARMKIALGAARGLAYLHEDSSPRVIHRDFKSSNILLEHDFTPKVSDFGLARTALDEGNDHISTRVMGTFGYVAPEYAMTGHLLVKSDVYSYGVVLLELLTGRKPVDMSQPPGQENLVNWARPLLTSMEGLSTMIDPALGMNISFDSVAKVAAIASMCTQPEVSHRPFMGEVVQALKLVCNESDEYRRSFSQDDSSTKDSDIRISTGSGQEERVVSETDMFCTSAAFSKDVSGSFRRYSSSGPLRDENSQKFWQRERGFLSGSLVETGASHSHKLGLDLERGEQWP